MNKLVVGNWKMNGRLAANEALLAGLVPVAGLEVVLCPPFPYLAQLAQRAGGVGLGAQNLSAFDDGACTGEVSAGMLADLGCSHVIIGHSERRALFAESDADVAAKMARAVAAGLRPIVCIGESLVERDAGLVFEVVGRQLAALESLLPTLAADQFVLAYEPVWAIGSGRAASAEQVAEVHDFIRAWLLERKPAFATVRILYGGSVKPENAAALFALDNVDGGLIGGAALDAAAFMAICRQAAG